MKKERSGSYHQRPYGRRKVRPHVRARAQRSMIQIFLAASALLCAFGVALQF